MKIDTTALRALCKSVGLPMPVAEHRFHNERKWRFDLAWPEPYLIALEIDGAVWTGGRHTRGAGWLKDAEKLNRAAIMGWRVLHCTPKQFESGEALEWVAECIMGPIPR